MHATRAPLPYYDEELRAWLFLQPSNLHTHFRWEIDDLMITVPLAARFYRYAVAMPNLKERRIREPQQAVEYRARIHNIAHAINPDFEAIVPMYAEPDSDPKVMLIGYESGAWRMMKIYPRNGTTNSDEGVDFARFDDIYGILAMAQRITMRHPEKPFVISCHMQKVRDSKGDFIDDWAREEDAIPVIDKALRAFPKNVWVIEHISTIAGIKAVHKWRQDRYKVEMTIAPQYLVWNRTKLLQGGMNPAWYSIPVLQNEKNREAIAKAFLKGDGFLGNDSAIHDVAFKSMPCGCAGGVFNEPVSLFVYFQVLKDSGLPNWFELFVDFASLKGPRFYGLEPPQETVAIIERPWKVPSFYKHGRRSAIPMLAGETIPYDFVTLPELRKLRQTEPAIGHA